MAPPVVAASTAQPKAAAVAAAPAAVIVPQPAAPKSDSTQLYGTEEWRRGEDIVRVEKE